MGCKLLHVQHQCALPVLAALRKLRAHTWHGLAVSFAISTFQLWRRYSHTWRAWKPPRRQSQQAFSKSRQQQVEWTTQMMARMARQMMIQPMKRMPATNGREPNGAGPNKQVCLLSDQPSFPERLSMRIWRGRVASGV